MGNTRRMWLSGVSKAVVACIAPVVLGVAIFAGQSISLIDPAHAQVTPIDEEEPDDTPGLGRITGTPDAGPSPEDAGDRGGTAQLALALVIFGGLAFIAWRIRAEVSRNRGANNHGQKRL